MPLVKLFKNKKDKHRVETSPTGKYHVDFCRLSGTHTSLKLFFSGKDTLRGFFMCNQLRFWQILWVKLCKIPTPYCTQEQVGFASLLVFSGHPSKTFGKSALLKLSFQPKLVKLIPTALSPWFMKLAHASHWFYTRITQHFLS